jgi:uncharacterized protein (TIGR02147 family)
MANSKNQKAHQILNKAFLAKKDKNPAYSQRALARDLGVSPVFVTKVLTGQKAAPSERFKEIFKVLDMDITLQSAFIKAAVLEALPSPELRKMATEALLADSKIETYHREPARKFGFLKQWYNVPILCYLTSETNDSSPEAIARYFGITLKEVEQALTNMEKEGLVVSKNGAWMKPSSHTYFPTTKSHEDVREFHRQMIQKAFKELHKTSQEDFDQRLITGFSIAVNPEHVNKAKSLIADLLAEVTHVLNDGECSEVYQCNVQLFPLKAKT